MTLFASTWSHDVRSELLFLVELTYMLYVLLSFIVVARYTAKKINAGRLINGRAAPLALLIPPAGDWLFVLNILALLFITSALYLAAILAALLLVLVADKILARNRQIMPQAGGWLFVLNVLALLLTQSPLYMMLVVAGMSVLLVESRRTAEKQFGLDRLSGPQLVKWSLLICGAVVVVAAPVMQIFELALNVLHLSHPEQQSVETFRQFTKSSQVLDFLIQAVIIAPMIEELFFRGFLLTFLKSYMSTGIAIALSAGVFACAHLNLDSVIPLWILGVVLGVAYEHTGSILLPMGIHACFNFITGLTLLVEKGNS